MIIVLHHLLKTIRIYFNSKKTPLEWQFFFFRKPTKSIVYLIHNFIVIIFFFLIVFENKDRIIMVLDCATKGELYDYINKRGKLTEKDARRIFRQIASAVNYCHQVSRSSRIF